MVQLLIHDAAPGDAEPTACFGGLPIAPAVMEFVWPTCRSCGGFMKFLGRLPCDAGGTHLVLLFHCQNLPGACSDWEADAGGNCALMVPVDAMRVIEPPDDGERFSPARYGVVVEAFDAPDYDVARGDWPGRSGRSPRHVIGQLQGVPGWIQGDDTPNCDCCQAPMQFLAQLEQGPDADTAMNFGGGAAYVFVCQAGNTSAKFLWQC